MWHKNRKGGCGLIPYFRCTHKKLCHLSIRTTNSYSKHADCRVARRISERIPHQCVTHGERGSRVVSLRHSGRVSVVVSCRGLEPGDGLRGKLGGHGVRHVAGAVGDDWRYCVRITGYKKMTT